MQNNRTVLVTGGTGFVGRAVVGALAADGWEVTVATRDRDAKTSSKVYLDLAVPESIIELEKVCNFGAVVHLGAAIGWSNQSAADLFVPNVLATGLLAAIAAKSKARFVFASAAIVHGVTTPAITASSSLLPDTAYGRSKWLGEQLISAAGAESTILRIGGVFGHNGPAHLGLNRAIENAMRKVPPQIVGRGSALRNYIYVKDVAAAVEYALRHDVTGVHLLAGSEVLSIRDMLDQLCEILLPGQAPEFVEGAEAPNQVVETSSEFPATRSFAESLLDISRETTG